jgi:hypothetical protein
MTLRKAPPIAWAFGFLLVAASLRGQRTQNPPARPPAQGDVLTVRNQFDTVLSYRTAAGETRRLRVARRQWSLSGHATIDRAREPGLLVVQLGAGEATVTVGQERRTRRSDEFWTVPPRAPFQIEVGREQATLEVFAVNEH